MSSVLPMTQNESDGEENNNTKYSWRNKRATCDHREKPALPITVTQELAWASTFFKEQVEHRASFSSRGNQNFLLFKHTLEKSIIYLCSPQNNICIKSRDTSKTCFSHLWLLCLKVLPFCTRSLLCIHRTYHFLYTYSNTKCICVLCVCVCVFAFKILERVSSSGCTPTSLSLFLIKTQEILHQ